MVNFEFAGLSEHVFQGHLQADSSNLQSCPRHVMASPREHRVGEGQSRPLLCRWFKAMEVHGRGSEHGQRRHKNVGEEVVGYLQR